MDTKKRKKELGMRYILEVGLTRLENGIHVEDTEKENIKDDCYISSLRN